MEITIKNPTSEMMADILRHMSQSGEPAAIEDDDPLACCMTETPEGYSTVIGRLAEVAPHRVENVDADYLAHMTLREGLWLKQQHRPVAVMAPPVIYRIGIRTVSAYPTPGCDMVIWLNYGIETF